MNRRLLVTIVIVAVALVLATVLDTILSNHRPTIIALEANAEKVTPSGTCQIACNASDADNDELSYNWSASGGEINGIGAVVTWIAPRSEGSYNVAVTVTDGNGGEVEDYVIIEVRANQPPQIKNVVADPEWAAPSASIRLICTASDPDEDVLSYEWIADGGDITGTGPEVDWIAPEIIGMYDITVVVKDDHGAEDIRLVKLSVATGTPPTLENLLVTANHKYLRENGSGYDYKVGKEQEYDIECIVSDTSVGVSYNWSCDGGEITGEGSVINWTAPNASSKITVTVIVSDITGNEASKSVILYVVNCSPCTFG